jgi:hypothetical protein
MPSNLVHAKKLVNPDEPVVESAERVALAVLEALEDHDVVTLSMDSVRGASSSFYNVIIQRVVERFGIVETERRLQFALTSAAQRMLVDRSIASVKAAGLAYDSSAASACPRSN